MNILRIHLCNSGWSPSSQLAVQSSPTSSSSLQLRAEPSAPPKEEWDQDGGFGGHQVSQGEGEASVWEGHWRLAHSHSILFNYNSSRLTFLKYMLRRKLTEWNLMILYLSLSDLQYFWNQIYSSVKFTFSDFQNFFQSGGTICHLQADLCFISTYKWQGLLYKPVQCSKFYHHLAPFELAANLVTRRRHFQ